MNQDQQQAAIDAARFQELAQDLNFGQSVEQQLPPDQPYMSQADIDAFTQVPPETQGFQQAGAFNMPGFEQQQQLPPQQQYMPPPQQYIPPQQPEFVQTQLQPQQPENLMLPPPPQPQNHEQIQNNQMVWDGATNTYVDPQAVQQYVPQEPVQQVQTHCPGSNLQHSVARMNEPVPIESNTEGVMQFEKDPITNVAPAQSVDYLMPEFASAIIRKYGKDEIVVREVIRSHVLMQKEDEAFIRHMIQFYKHIAVDDARWDSEYAQQITYNRHTRILILNDDRIGYFTLDEEKPDLKATLHGLLRVHNRQGKLQPSIWKAFKKYRMLDIIIEGIKHELNIHSLNIKLPEYLEKRSNKVKTTGLSTKEKNETNYKYSKSFCRYMLDYGFQKRGQRPNDDRKNGLRISTSDYQINTYYWKPEPVVIDVLKDNPNEEKDKTKDGLQLATEDVTTE